MSDLISPNIQFARDLSFNILGIPPSIEEISQAKAQAVSVITHFQFFLIRTLLFSAVMFIIFASSVYFVGLGLGIGAAFLLLISFSALLASYGAFGTSAFFLLFANLMAIFALSNQHIGALAFVCLGLVCTSLPYFRLGMLKTKRADAEQKLAELEPVDDDALPILNAWAETYPACRYYFDQVSKMQRSVTRVEYEAAYDLVFELNKGFAGRYRKSFNYVPFFFG